MMRHDARQDLGLPLVRLRLRLRNRAKLFIQRLCRRHLRHKLIEAFAAMAIRTARRHDDDAAFLRRRLAGRHAFHRLVDVLVQRITTVARDDDVRLRHVDPAEAVQVVAARRMRGQAVARERLHHLLFTVDDDVYDEFQSDFLRRPHHVAMDRISLQYARTGLRRMDEHAAVVGQNSFHSGDARQDAFPSTGESRKEMRLDKSFRHKQIRLRRHTIHPQFAAGRKNAQIRLQRIVMRFMDDDGFVFDDFIAELFLQFLQCRAAMHACRDQNRDIR